MNFCELVDYKVVNTLVILLKLKIFVDFDAFCTQETGQWKAFSCLFFFSDVGFPVFPLTLESIR